MRSTWLRLRNVVANTAGVGAGLSTYKLNCLWPDLIVGGLIAALFIRSAWTLITESIEDLRTSNCVKECDSETVLTGIKNKNPRDKNSCDSR